MIHCKDCIHIRAPLSGAPHGEYSTCAFGLAENPVTGEINLPTQNYSTCLVLRKSTQSTDCGPAARFFEARVFAQDVAP